MTESRWMIAKLIQWMLFVTCFVMVCPFCCQAGSLTVVLSTLVMQYFFHSYFLWWLHFFVSCISLRVLCGYFIYSDEMFPATYPSIDMLHCLNVNDCKTLFNGCCSVTCFVMVCPFCCQAGSLTVVLSTGFAIFLHSCFKYYLHFFVGISLRALCDCFICSDVKCCFNNWLSIMI